MKLILGIQFIILSILMSSSAYCATISGQVWQDIDASNIKDAGEPFVQGVTVVLMDAGMNIVQTDTTDIDGKYVFNGLSASSYFVQFMLHTAPMGWRKPAVQNSGFFFDVDSDADPTGLTSEIIISGAGSDIPDIDLGLEVTPTATISGNAWQDMDDNHIKNTGDTNLANILVSLVDSFGLTIYTDTTDTNGNYVFTPVEYGKYVVIFDTASFPPNLVPVIPNTGTNDTIDSDAFANGKTDTIQVSGNIDHIDIGLRDVPQTFLASGQVWYDINNNGLFESGEIGINNVFVHLLDTTDTTIQTDTTDANGQYQFQNITSGNYTIQFDTSSYSNSYQIVAKDVGSDDQIDSDANANGRTDIINIFTDVTNIDLGLFNPPIYGSSNGRVWHDENMDNLFSFDESGIAGIGTFLISNTGDTTQTTLTDTNGKYSFSNIVPGSYHISFDLNMLPAGFVISEKDYGSDDSIDSDVDSLGQSDSLMIVAGNTVNFIDMGVQYVTIVQSITKDTIYLQTNENQPITICLDTLELNGNVVTSQLCSTPAQGSISAINKNCFNYTPFTNHIGQDSFCMVVCDDLGVCDTTMINITIKALSHILPITLNDVDTTEQGVPTQLKVISNDTLNAPLQSLTILEYPTLGVAQADSFGFINYIPEPNICEETVSLVYEACTEFGCDTASASIYLKCNNIKIRNGFSPNGDGINDQFVIQGISKYPNNRLIIFNRWGNKVWEQSPYDNSWTGYWDDEKTDLPNGTYFYIFETGEGGRMTGSIEINR